MSAEPRPGDPVTPAGRPRRPATLIVGLVTVNLSTLLFGMVGNAADGPGGAQLPSVALLFALLAIRFNWARITTTVLLALFELMWFPAMAWIGSDDYFTYTAGTYAVIAIVVSVIGLVLLYQPRSNGYYTATAAWRAGRGRVTT